MSDTLSKVLKIVLAILFALSFAILIWFFNAASGIDSSLDASAQIEQYGASLEYFIDWAYLLLGGAVVLTLGFAVLGMVTDLKSTKKALPGILGFIAVLVISWFLASDAVLNMPTYTGTGNDPVTLKWSDAGIIATYILLAGAGISIVYSEVSKAFK